MKSSSNLDHMAQWETTRLEAEARLGRESNLSAFPATAAPQFFISCLDPASDSIFSGNSTGLGEVSDSVEIASRFFRDPVETLMSFASRVPVVPILDGLREEDSTGRSAEAENCVGIGEQMEEYTNCWDQVLDLVTSSAVTISSPQKLENKECLNRGS
jgi:hypothetical protein